MLDWLKSFQEAAPQTKYFVLTWIVFGLAIVLSTLFVYGRMDYVRSDQALRQHNSNATPE